MIQIIENLKNNYKVIKIKDFTAKLFQKKDNLMVAEATSNKKETTEKEIQHYHMMYSEDEEHYIKRNYKI